MLAVLYAGIVYLFFLATFVYAIFFVGDTTWLPTSVNHGLSSSAPVALLIDLWLLALFAVQHSVMARRSFKAWISRYLPAHVERSNFVLAATVALALLVWQWRPITEPVMWEVSSPFAKIILTAVFWCGWAMLLVSTFLLDHFDLFGLRQAWVAFRGTEVQPPVFRTPLFYRYVRHPLYVGFILAFWATPRMTAGQLLFAVATTVYIFVGIWFEERDLMVQFGERYRAYRSNVGMVLPKLGGRG